MTAAHGTQTGTDRILAALSTRGKKPRKNGAGWVTPCPNPDHGKGRGDRNPSLSIGSGANGDALITCHAGCHTTDVLAALNLTTQDMFTDAGDNDRGTVHVLRTFTPSTPPRPEKAAPKPDPEMWKPRPATWTPPPAPTGPECTEPECAQARARESVPTRCVARYLYEDIEGVPAGVVHRWDPKSFRPFTSTEQGGAWCMGGRAPFPYQFTRLIEVFRNGGTVFIVEGEKDADTINDLGRDDLAATTNSGGAGKWTNAHSEALCSAGARNGDAKVIVCSDTDDAGQVHAEKVMESLADSGFTDVLVVWPTRGKDITEHLDNGGTLDIGTVNGLRAPNRYPGLGQIYTIEDLEGLPPIRPRIDGWLSTPSAAMLIGGYGLGKSALTLSMACSVATGSSFLGIDTEQTRVLYLVGEGVYGIPMRLRAWQQTWGRGIDRDFFHVVKPGYSLRDEKMWRTLRAFAKDGGYGFVVLDTFSSLAPDADETKDAPIIMAGLNGLAESIDGTALMVHHPGWSQTTQDRARGGYQIEGNADEVLVMTGAAEGAEHVSVKVKKRKDGEAGKIHYLRRVVVNILGPNGLPMLNDQGRPVTSVTMEHARVDDSSTPIRERILTYLAQCGDIGATPKEIAAEIGAEGSNGSYKQALGALKREGTVRSEGRTTSVRYYLEDA